MLSFSSSYKNLLTTTAYLIKAISGKIRVRGLSPNGLLLPWALVLGPGTAKLFIFFFSSSFFWVGSVLRNRNSSEKALAAMSHS